MIPFPIPLASRYASKLSSGTLVCKNWKQSSLKLLTESIVVQVIALQVASSTFIQFKLGLAEALKLAVEILLLFPFFTFRLVNWLLLHFKIVKAIFRLTSKFVNWLLLHPKVFKAVFWLTSKLVNWLSLQVKIFKYVFWLTSKPASWLFSHCKVCKTVFWLTSIFVNTLL